MEVCTSEADTAARALYEKMGFDDREGGPGGPLNHFGAGYDGLAQLLANRGYAVFQSNFRGSTGHGRDYMFAAHGDYGNGRVQQDIVDGVRFLAAQGIGDECVIVCSWPLIGHQAVPRGASRRTGARVLPRWSR